MSDDRALLEAAANAAGISVQWHEGCDELCCARAFAHDPPRRAGDWEIWNPLTDDADALRLAVKLRIDVCFASDMLFTQTTLAPTPMFKEQYGGDEMAATRRAIVRAAAALAPPETGEKR